MSFTSLPFVLFAALTLLVYFLVPKKGQWIVLLAASYVFYFFAGAWCLLFLAVTTLLSYFCALWMQKRADAEDLFVEQNRAAMEKSERKEYRAKEKKKRFRILVVGLILGFGILAVIKYTAFVLTGVKSLTGADFTIPSLILPLGISFYVFQSMGYLIDVYRQKSRAETNLFRFALFVSFFPQLVQGPISRHSALAEQLQTPHSFDRQDFFAGLLRVLFGFFKKVVIADTAMRGVRTLVTETGDAEFRGVYVFVLILLYSAEIYGDFTGGIDVTIGLSRMMGIRLAENFDRPFSSESTKEYWRRWHITMGTWFTDYVFYPLSVCKPMQKLSALSRKKLGNAVGKRIPVYLATVVTWFLTGLWHGAGMNFIVWGLLNCLVILVSQELQPLYLRFHKRFPSVKGTRGWHLFCVTRTFLLMGLIRSLDCYRDVGRTFRLWGSMVTTWNLPELFRGGLCSFGLDFFDWGVILAGTLAVLLVTQAGKKEPLRERVARRPVLLCLSVCVLCAVILIFGSYGIGFDASDFIYGQF